MEPLNVVGALCIILVLIFMTFYKVIVFILSALALSSAMVFIFSGMWRQVWLEAWKKKLNENPVAFIGTFLLDLLIGGVLCCIDFLEWETTRKKHHDSGKK